MDFSSICDYLQDTVRWKHYVDFVEMLGPQLNKEGLRFLKSRFIEKAICHFCGVKGDMEWIDERGRDIKIHSFNMPIECKFHRSCLISENGKTKDILGKGVKLYNSNGTNKRCRLAKEYSKFVLLLDSRAAAIIKKPGPDAVKPNGDSITLKGVPLDQAYLLFEYDDYEPSTKFENLDSEQQNFIVAGLDRLVMDMVEKIIFAKKGN